VKLFKAEVQFRRKRAGRYGADVIVHARSRAAAENHLRRKYIACQLTSLVDLGTATKHFVIADLVED